MTIGIPGRRGAVASIIIVMLLALLCCSAHAQTTDGTLRGQVTDPSGSAVGTATVIVTTPSGAAVTANTNRDGVYELKNLAPGKYSVKIIAPGFTEVDRDAVEIAAGQVQKLDARLNIETQEEKVMVTDQAATTLDVNPASNAGAIVLQGKDLEALSDDPDELQSDLQALAGPSAGPNGGQIYIDGFTAGQLPPKASIREIRINQNPFSAEYDKLGYGRIEILTKPGTDQWHGQLFLTGTTAGLNSRNPFERLPAGEEPPGYESTQFSGNIGGPLSKKASIFFNYEQRNINNLNVVSAQIVDPTTFAVTPFSAAVPNPDTRINLSPRLDYQLGAGNTLSVRYQYYRQTQDNESVGAFSLPSLATNQFDSENTLQVSDTQTLSPRWINETRFQYVHEVANQNPLSTAPEIIVTGAFATGGNVTGINNDTQNRYELQDETYLTFGKHALKIGGRLRSTLDDNSTNQTFNGQFSFGKRLLQGCTVTATTDCQVTPLEAYQITLQGLAANLPFTQIQAMGGGASFYSLAFNPAGRAVASVSYVDGSIFVQDDYRWRPNVSISYGLRYETQNNLGDHADWAPRVGLAWGIGAKKNAAPKTVLRAGFGIFYDRFTSDGILEQQLQNGSIQQQFLIPNPAFFDPNNTVLPSQFQGAIASPQTIYVPNPNLRTPYTMQTGVSVERQLTKAANIAVTYLNSRGLHSFYTNFINANDLGAPPPDQILYQYQSDGIFKQNQLIVNGSIRMGTKLSLFGYYVLNYANSNTAGPTAIPSYIPSDPHNPSLDYGRAVFDYRNRLFMGGTVGLPKGFRLSPFLVASSGPPFNITTGDDLFGDAQFNARPAAATCGAPAANIVQTKYGCFNLTPTPGESLIPIFDAQGPARFAMNVRLSKTFGFGRKKEATNTGGPGGPGGGGTFGRGPGGGPGGGGRGGGGFGGGRGPGGFDAPSNRRYGLTFAVSARNIFNNVNEATPIGNLSSPLFGEANGLTGGPYSSNTANRRLDLQVTFTF